AFPFGELLVDDPQLVALARKGQLALSIFSSEPGETVQWFCRVEKAGTPAAEGRARLRVFIFRFPQPLGRLILMPRDASRLRQPGMDARAARGGWWELWRLCALARREEAAYREFCDIQGEIGDEYARWLPRLRMDGSAPEFLQQQRERAERTA